MFINSEANVYYHQHRYDLISCRSLPYNDRVAVIIETRNNPILPWTINNILYYTQWPVIVYHSKSNTRFLKGLDIKKKVLLPSKFSIREYNELITSKHFWRSMPMHVLLFQTDSFMIRPGIDSFLKYDYVGAPWTNKNLKCFSIPKNIGNGGFSLRRRDKMLEIINSYAYQKGIPEDIYFAHGFQKTGGTLPSLTVKKRFSVEHLYYDKPLAVHAPWLTLDSNKLKKILRDQD